MTHAGEPPSRQPLAMTGAKRRPSWGVVAFAAAAVLTAFGARPAAEPSSAPRFEWFVDGFVNVTARLGNTLYVGGSFRRIVPPSGLLGRLYAVSPPTGAQAASGLPTIDATNGVRVLADGSGGYYLHGNLTIGTGNAVGRVVHIRPDGSVDPAFNSPPNLRGYGVMARVGPSLVLGGFFTLDGALRPLVALDPVTGALSPWVPALPAGDEAVRDLEVVGGRVFVTSSRFYGSPRYVTAFDGISGAVVWQTDVAGVPGGAGGAMAVAGNRLIVSIGQLYSLDPATGAVDPAWVSPAPATGGFVGDLKSDGATVYVAGSFTGFGGQARSRLAAVNAPTGALLPWNPVVSDTVRSLVLSATGTAFVSSAGTINGQTRPGGLFEIDGAGAVTAFALQVDTDSADAVALSTSGALFVGGAPGFAGVAVRQSVAAFDLSTGALLPFTVTMQSSSSDPPTVWKLVAHDQSLHLRGPLSSVGGQPASGGVASVDAVTGARLPAWSTPGLSFDQIGPLDAGWLYLSARPAGSQSTPTPRRLNPATGLLDPAWVPPPMHGSVVVDRGELLFNGVTSGFGVTNATFVGSLDAATGQFRELFRTTAFLSSSMSVDGGTLYLNGGAGFFGPFEPATTIYAFDRNTGVPVWRPPVRGRLHDFAIADGRVFAAGSNLTVGGVERFGAIELTRTGVSTGWDGGFRAYGAPITPAGALAGGATGVEAHGDVLAVWGSGGPDVSRVAVYGLSGTAGPVGLQTRNLGGFVEFTWDAATPPPAGGYVIEGGYGPGQTASAVAVGTATSFSGPLSVRGPAFVRVRSQGSTEVSNEVVFGCAAPPLPPTALTTMLNGSMVSLTWQPPSDPVTSYTLSGGVFGASNVATVPLPGTQTSIGGTVPGGTFFARVIASNACGTSGPSGEVFFTIGAPDPLPAAPTNLAASMSGSTVSLTWAAPAGPVTGYVIEGGTAAGLANIGTIQIGAVTSFAIPGAPPGAYALRVRAITSAGNGAPSTDVVVVVQ